MAGDDYGLLFTVPRKLVARLRHAPSNSEITRIGEILAGRRITLVDADGRAQPLKPDGWDSFRRQSSQRNRVSALKRETALSVAVKQRKVSPQALPERALTAVPRFFQAPLAQELRAAQKYWLSLVLRHRLEELYRAYPLAELCRRTASRAARRWENPEPEFLASPAACTQAISEERRAHLVSCFTQRYALVIISHPYSSGDLRRKSDVTRHR